MTTRAETTDDALRASLYLLLANLLAAPPDGRLLAVAARLDGGETELGRGIRDLSAAARIETPQAIEAEYNALFIGIGRGELVPYASYYLTGFMNDRPLARLRDDMRRLGIVRAEEVREPEDHIAALCEMMGGLASDAFGQVADEAQQRAFFDTHLKPWAPRFFRDLQRAGSARFYRPVGRFGHALLAFDAAHLASS